MSYETLEKICQQLSLGNIECTPTPLKGGLMHKMYSLFTTKGKYAVKLLNPAVMERETAMSHYRHAEKLEVQLEQYDIPILPAMVFQDKKMQQIDRQFFYLYRWYDGKTLKNKEIKTMHCRKIGKFLAQMHKIDLRPMSYTPNLIQIDWDFYIDKMESKNDELYHILLQNRTLLYDTQEKGNCALQKLPSGTTICHNDLDRKNVLWNGSDFRVIDLECLSYANPFLELFETARYWSENQNGKIDYHLFSELINSYSSAGGQLPTDWETIYDSSNIKLEWLEFNLKRVLGIHCSAEESALGFSEAKNTIAHIIYDDKARNQIVRFLENQNLSG